MQWPLFLATESCKFKPTFPDKYQDQNPIYEFITPLRCLLIHDASPANWKVMQKMEQHTTLRQNDAFYKVNQVNTVAFIRRFVELPR